MQIIENNKKLIIICLRGLLLVVMILGITHSIGKWISIPSLSFIGFGDKEQLNRKLPKKITVHMGGASSYVLGTKQLGARSAEENHLKINFNGSSFSLQNISKLKKVVFTRKNEEGGFDEKNDHHIREWKLEPGVVLTLGKNVLSVIGQDDGKLSFEINGDLYTLKDRKFSFESPLSGKKKIIHDCYSWIEDIRHNIAGSNEYKVYLGGDVFCAHVFPLENVAFKGFIIQHKDNDFFVRPQSMGILDSVITRIEKQGIIENNMRNHKIVNIPIGEKIKIIIGRSIYQLTFNEEKGQGELDFDLRSQGHRKDIEMRGQNVDRKKAFTNGLWGAIFGMLSVIIMWVGSPNKRKKRTQSLKSSLIILFPLGLIGSILVIVNYEYFGDSFGYSDYAAYLMVLIIGTGFYLFKNNQDIYPFFIVITILVCLGIYLSWVLQHQHSDTKYLHDFGMQLFYILLGYQVWSQIIFKSHYLINDVIEYILKIFQWERLNDLSYKVEDFFIDQVEPFYEKISDRWNDWDSKIAIGIKVIIKCMPWVAFWVLYVLSASETGYGGLQPLELVKLLFCIFISLSFLEKVRQRYRKIKNSRSWKGDNYPILLLLLFFGYIVSLAVVVDDFSYPIIIGWSIVMALLGVWLIPYIELAQNNEKLNVEFWPMPIPLAKNHRKWSAGLGLIVLVLAPIGFVFILNLIFLYVIPWVSDSFYIDRINTWQAPFLYQHSGFQFNYAKCVLSLDNCLLDGHGSKNIEMINLINVDDDFAPTGLLSQGLYPFTILLVSAQLGWVATSLFLVYTAYKKVGKFSKDLRFFSLFVLAGIGVFQAHVLIAWGTNSGLLPVMGQPMSFIGRQGSHLILFLFPFIWGVTFLFYRAINSNTKDGSIG